MAFNIVNHLIEKEFMDCSNRESVIEHIEKIIVDELSLEDKLDEEVRQILSQYSTQIQKDNIDYHEMFRKIKRIKAKERNIIL
ncbi:MAG: hypothetical protein A2Y62_13080 [Candidatus Fischerbacteria bacterium RBG_13_37_8]|uniref:DUF507 domain-containing protein n=1 Tax=Candidatus Fischerbacteria bacterium RBG_13_37_8 TaxID=1817863 RepID=A0A1F5V5N1_9BACT|nr:MAG: hypothetical protein A2Y62_13080 [Candidatus Fischerbacteria bacterium RBG_13_37_8]